MTFSELMIGQHFHCGDVRSVYQKLDSRKCLLVVCQSSPDIVPAEYSLSDPNSLTVYPYDGLQAAVMAIRLEAGISL